MSSIVHLAPCLVLPAGLLLDTLLGEPPARIHPVCAMGALAQRLENGMRRLFRLPRPAPDADPSAGDSRRALAAGVLAAGLMALVFAGSAAIVTLSLSALSPLAGAAAAAACLWLCMAPRALSEHALRVASPLDREDLEGARTAVSMIVGRDPRLLDAHGVGRACVESVAENLTDGVLASIFWACAGLWLAGPAGAAGLVVLQRVMNTLDAMWGRRNARYIRFGTFAARMDDVLGFLPARLALPFTALAALHTRGCSARGALSIGWRDRHAHESPNSAWSEAAFAGALGLRLGGPAVYAGRLVPHPFLGEGRAEAVGDDIRTACRLMKAATLDTTLVLTAGVILLS